MYELYLFLCLSLHPCALSLECQPCHRFAFRNCLPPLVPPFLRLPGVHREDFVTAGGQVVARRRRSVRHHYDQEERGRYIQKSTTSTEQTLLPPLSVHRVLQEDCSRKYRTTCALLFGIPQLKSSSPRTILYFSVSRAHTRLTRIRRRRRRTWHSS